MLRERKNLFKGEKNMKKQIKVTCYNKDYFFDSRKKAIAHFKEGMMWCDPYSSEHERYEMIVDQLKNGQMVATDNI